MISRRSFVAVAAMAMPSVACVQERNEAQALYARSVVVDGNLYMPLSNTMTKVEVEAFKASGITAVKVSLGGFANGYAETLSELNVFDRALALYPEDFVQIRTVADINDAKRSGQLGVIYSFEGVECLEGGTARVREFAARGVKVMQLCYNLPSPFGAGVLADPALSLTALGREAVAVMNASGVAIDLSHANPATTAGAIEASTKPVLITHAGCAAVHGHVRNKSDEQLRALAEKGGVVGIYDLPYLTPSPRQPTLEDYMAHMTHALNVCGEDHVGIGSDTEFVRFDTSPEAMEQFQDFASGRRAAGVAAPEEDRPPYVEGLNHVRRCETIAGALLRRRYPARVVDKVLGGNFVRAFGEIW